MEGEKETAIFSYSNEQVGELLRRVCGGSYFIAFQDEACVGSEPMSPKDDDDCDNWSLFCIFIYKILTLVVIQCVYGTVN